MSGKFRRMLTSTIFSYFFTLIIIALVAVYGYGTYHAYRHSTLQAFMAGILIVPAFYYVYESETVVHHPCAVQDCDHLSTEIYDTPSGRKYICDSGDDTHKRLKTRP